MYGHPRLPYPVQLTKDTVVEHKYQPGVPLVIVSGPHESLTAKDRYIVRKPTGAEEPVLRRNLKI
jgi:hypothetical protein